jgi:hypothetical protein
MKNADKYDFYDFGIIKKGNFINGMNGFITTDHIDETFPLWMHSQPVISIINENVYLRGLHSKTLTSELRLALHGR